MNHLLLLVLALALVAAYALMGATAAGASPGLTVGIAGNQFIDAPVRAKAAEGLGLGGVRVFLHWRGERTVSDVDKLRLSHLKGRSLVTVYGYAKDAPLTATGRKDYAAYVASVVRLSHPWAISVWNEPNLPGFWAPGNRRIENYTRLLARTYDAVKRIDPSVLVLGGETVRSYGVELWVKRMGTKYRSMRRSKTKKLMDGFAHHPYPQLWFHRAAVGSVQRELWILQGDVARLRAALSVGFRGTAQKRWTPIYWTETGWTTGGPDWGGFPVSEQVQGERMVEATELAYCQRRVKGIFFFGLWDDPLGRGMWQTGVLDSALKRKPSFDALASAIQNVNAGNVDCGRFPEGSL